ncbi:hypothetical protein OG689_11060 [Kitasatospora sp. NBC_00240]|uniref:hypothetical protein n=1 Tax=Kitasatospora sp. NBC_00240 TaxID=2903567 RepID=UPI002252CDE9|nr:hypothetical protein [Kitasatospora sp. NBC_00240]MCX5209824.1 hypothetical protein [Kitasatospora sp. NBC_00240]
MTDRTCWLTGCLGAPAVQWSRRPSEAELANIVAAEQVRRDEIIAAADPEQPAPQFDPLPTAADIHVAVHACSEHPISMDLATLTHAATCTTPLLGKLPSCGCTPENAAPPTPPPATVTLPTGWVIASPEEPAP